MVGRGWGVGVGESVKFQWIYWRLKARTGIGPAT